MKYILKLLKRDFKMTAVSMTCKFSFFFAIFLLYNFLIIQDMKAYGIVDSKSIILKVFKGCNYITNSNGNIDNTFKFPVDWLLINVYILYTLGDYFYKDIKFNGKYLLYRCGNMCYIYISKIIWIILNILIYYIIILLLSILMGKIFSYPGEIFDYNYSIISNRTLIIYVGMLFLFTSISLSIILCTFTFKIRPIYSFFITILLCVLSVFTESRYFIGQHSLLLRHEPFEHIHNLTMNYSIIFNVIISIICLIVGIKISKKKEML